jgi:hypothetical protein
MTNSIGHRNALKRGNIQTLIKLKINNASKLSVTVKAKTARFRNADNITYL